MLTILLNYTVMANAQQELQIHDLAVHDLADGTQPLILYGEDASEAWGNLDALSSTYSENVEKRFYGSDIVIMGPAKDAEIVAHIPAGMDRDDTTFKMSAEDAGIIAHIPNEIAEALGRDTNKIMVPVVEIAEALGWDNITFKMSAEDAGIIAHIPDGMGRDDTTITVRVEDLNIFWSCSTPDPSLFWEQFLIRSKEEVVTCLWGLQDQASSTILGEDAIQRSDGEQPSSEGG